jgi:hypothetical protein
VRQVATLLFYQDKFPADWILNSRTFSDNEHRLREIGHTLLQQNEKQNGSATRAADRNTGWRCWNTETSERRIAGAEHIASSAVWRVLRQELSTPISEAKVLSPKLTLIKWRFVSGPNCSVILLFSPSCYSETQQEEFEVASGSYRVNLRGQMSVHRESIRRETNKDLKQVDGHTRRNTGRSSSSSCVQA